MRGNAIYTRKKTTTLKEGGGPGRNIFKGHFMCLHLGGMEGRTEHDGHWKRYNNGPGKETVITKE